MHIIQEMNHNWLYKPSFDEKDTDSTDITNGFEAVELPHTNKMLPYNYVNEKDYQIISCYKKTIALAADLKGKSIFVDFEGVMTACEVWTNGVLVGEHRGGYTPFSVDITKAANLGGDNMLVVKVDSTEREDIPPFGGMVDYLTYGGIYREVSLRIVDATRLERIWLSCPNALEKAKTLVCVCDITSANAQGAKLTLSLADASGNVVKSANSEVSLESGDNKISINIAELKGIKLWDIDAPALYTVTARLECGDMQDEISDRFGFRKAVFTTEGFYLNDRELKLVGLNRHQSYPYVGYAMPERVQRKDSELLKKETGINIVRTSHYPQSRHFLNACDELGLLVIEELPGWQHIGDKAWQDVAMCDISDMITRDYNHASIILWGVRINESADNHDFYTRTNALEHSMDKTRQSGGTRYITHSEFLEDVYTYNDFSHSGGEVVFRPQRESTGLEKLVPTIVTESNGHMYPTKRFDQEVRSVEHAMRHLRVINESRGRDDIVGGISWCAFDYNTHGSFGSGDKICYHGVYDMFRNPKYAAFAYESQRDIALGVVLEPITQAARGERDGGGTMPFYILTNCDYVRVYKEDKLIGDFYPDTQKFPHLLHAPVTVPHLLPIDTDLGFAKEDCAAFRDFLATRLAAGALSSMSQEDIQYLGELSSKSGKSIQQLMTVAIKVGGGWGDDESNLKLCGYVDDKKVCERDIGECRYYSHISAIPDDKALVCDGDTYDATRVVVSALDNFGGIMPFTQECVEVTLQGPAQLMGPARFAVTGGMAAFWVRTVGKAGEVTVTVEGASSSCKCAISVR